MSARRESAESLRVVIGSASPLADEYINGVNNSVRRTLEYLDAHGHDALVYAPTPSPANYANAPIIELPSLPFEGFPVGYLDPTRTKRQLKRFAPDVLHSASPFGPADSQLLKLARKHDVATTIIHQTEIPEYAEQHGYGRIGYQFAADRIAKLYERGDQILAPSAASMASLARYGVDMSRVDIWRRGVDTTLFHPARRDTQTVRQLREQLACDGRPIALYVGRLAVEKQLEQLSAFGGAPAQLVLVGKGSDEPRLRQLLSPIGAVFVGPKYDDELANYYAAADLFIHTGANETFGQTIQEAMASELPVIAPRQGGPVDTIEHEQSGFLYRPGDGVDLRRYADQLLQDPSLRRRMGARGLQLVQSRSWTQLGDELVGHYRRAITVRSTPRG